LLELAKKILQDLWTVSFNAWRKNNQFSGGKKRTVVFLCLILLVFILCWFVLSRIPEKTGEISYTKNVLANVEYQQLLTGLAVLLAAGIRSGQHGFMWKMRFPGIAPRFHSSRE
jgi:predicted ABC-type sugar transport system permease subunit